MESQGHQEHQQAPGLGSAGEEHEKKSVLEKVKVKANEIKDAITNHEDDASRQDLSDYTTFDSEQVGVSNENGITFGGGQTHPAGPHTGGGGRPTEPATQF